MKYVLMLSILFLLGCKSDAKEEALVKSDVVTEHIELEVYDFAGIEKYLYTDNNKVYVVNFWATWCAPCVKELPYFEELNANYAKENVEVILVSLDFPKKYESKLKPFITKYGLKSKVIALDDADSNSWIPKVDEQWSGAIPATLIYTKDKRQFYEQSFNYDELETELKQFLN